MNWPTAVLLNKKANQVALSFSLWKTFYSVASFKRDLEFRARNEYFRAFFRLPKKEKLHEVADCSLWTPFSRCHTVGRMFASESYICFASKEDGCCNVLIPLVEVSLLPL